ncbi:MAG: S-layer homology domain-containing protein [Candidatus Gracilibacteria bacterium]|nr:S-layer homology domain-containing protein [Candidatus Gracilibacteria bacterium]MDD2908397.1 S-layer homology domain-containing protein [Candidatus Gracilibacteria bacterium]
MKKSLIFSVFVFLTSNIYASEINGSINTNTINNGIQISLPCNISSVLNGHVDSTTCAITCNSSYALSGNSCINVISGSSGGGGGGALSRSTTNTSSEPSSSQDISSVVGSLEKVGPVKFSCTTTGNIRSAQLTSETGNLTIESQYNSKLKLNIPSGVAVSSDLLWDGNITPPMVIKNDNANKNNLSLVMAGSEKYSLKFNKEIIISIPLALKDGTEIIIYHSDYSDLSDIQTHGVYKVKNGFINIPTNHLSHFILKKKIQNHVGDLSFNDTQDSFANEDINNLAYLGVVKGFSDGTFKPNNSTTRAEFLAMTMKAMNITVDNGITLTSFTDIPSEGVWMNKYIQKAKEMGVINGQIIDGKLSFRPNDSITRAESISILLNLANIPVDKTVSSTNFIDIENKWMNPYVFKAQTLGIINGQIIDGQLKFRPNDPITRAESSRIINKVLIDYPIIPTISL